MRLRNFRRNLHNELAADRQLNYHGLENLSLQDFRPSNLGPVPGYQGTPVPGYPNSASESDAKGANVVRGYAYPVPDKFGSGSGKIRNRFELFKVPDHSRSNS
eukprot:2203655-Rhodomonas_salina.1